MDTSLINALQAEERGILDELRASSPFRRLEEIRRLLLLYREDAPVGAGLDAMLAAHETPAAARHPQPQSVIVLHGSERA